jgi:hypothetical protein
MTTLICLDISSKLFFVSDDSKTVHWLDLLVDGIGVPAGSERIHITIMLIMKRELIMKKFIVFLLTSILFSYSLCFAATLNSLNKDQFINAFVNKTSVSIATDNLNGVTIENTFSMFLDGDGNIIGKMSHKPVNEPQTDKGIYSIDKDGTAYITWQHWDGAKKLCFRAFNTENSYINVGCDDVFHTVFMKEAIKPGNLLK